jgi:hypothetical protein
MQRGRFPRTRMDIVGKLLRAIAGRTRRHREARERHVPVGMDSERQLLPAQRQGRGKPEWRFESGRGHRNIISFQ